MSEDKKRLMIERRTLVASLYGKNYNYRRIAQEVASKLMIPVPSLKTIHSDVQANKREWQKERIQDTGERIERELIQIDETISELWEQWEKSKTDTKLTNAKSRKESGSIKIQGIGTTPTTKDITESGAKQILMLGDVRYIAEIRAQLQERRKLEGLYPAEKMNVGNSDGKPFQVDSSNSIDYDQLPTEVLLALLNATKKTE